MDNVFAQIKTTELKGSTFRSRILDFGDFDISDAEFKIVFKRAGNVLPLTNFEPQKVGNALVIPYNILESYSSEIRMEAWMTLNGITDLALVDTMLISAENQLKSDATNQNVSVTFGDVVIPVTFTQAIVQFGGGTGIATWDSIQNKPTQFPPENHTHSYNDLNDKPTIPQPVDISGKQDVLVSGTNIKTVNGQSILGAGNIQIEGSGGGGTNPATTFDPSDNVNASTMRASALFLMDEFNIVGNDLPITLTTVNSYINSVGVVTSSSNWRTSELMPINFGSYIYYGRTNNGTSARAVAGYDVSGVFVSIILATVDGTTGIPFTISADSPIRFVRVCSHMDYTLRLSQSPGKYYRIKHSFVPPTSNYLGKSWGAIGTSITYYDGRSAIGYQSRVAEIFGFTTITNYGYQGNSLGGTTLADANSILNKTGWVSHDIFSMESITNDFKRNIPIGVRADYNNNTGITTYFGALRAFKDKIATLNPSAIIIVANALKRNNAGYTSTSANTAGHTLLDYEKALLEIALLNDWRFIDQNRESGINDDNLAFTTSDGLHPNNFGYRLISKVWIREFWLLSKTS